MKPYQVARGLVWLTLVVVAVSAHVAANNIRRRASDGSVYEFGRFHRKFTFWNEAIPEQIHMALGDSKGSGMTITWMTKAKTETSVVEYGEQQTNLASVEGGTSQYQFKHYTSGFIHSVSLSAHSWRPSTRYIYRCGDRVSGIWSPFYSFTTPPPVGASSTITFGVVGDLGQTQNSLKTLEALMMDRDGYPKIDVMLIPGDLSYADGVPERWDSWGKLVENLTTVVPLMTAPGNHEIYEDEKFIAYKYRFPMPEDPINKGKDRLFYSVDVGPTHLIFLNSYILEEAPVQKDWLQRDLQSVNREKTPWVLLFMHNPWYNSNWAHQDADEPQWILKQELETILYRYKVDAVFAGHVHAYERTYPVFQGRVVPEAPYYFTVGGGGNREGLADAFMDPQPEWSAFRAAKYGGSRIEVLNATHCRIEWFSNDQLLQRHVAVHVPDDSVTIVRKDRA